jgi:hypothetical protein
MALFANRWQELNNRSILQEEERLAALSQEQLFLRFVDGQLQSLTRRAGAVTEDGAKLKLHYLRFDIRNEFYALLFPQHQGAHVIAFIRDVLANREGMGFEPGDIEELCRQIRNATQEFSPCTSIVERQKSEPGSKE